MTDFLASMPAAYARAFAAPAVAEHARIVARRGAQLAHAELCQTGNNPSVCVVADDRPGLLVLVTDALLLHGLGIRSAQAYCRQCADGSREAVDFLELQPPVTGTGANDSAGFDATELGAFLQTLTELIAEDVRVSEHGSSVPPPSGTPTRVYFELEALRQGDYVLLVEAPDWSGLLNAITSTLYARGVRILACQIGTEGGIARDRFELAGADAQPLTAVDLCDLQLAVFDALPRRRS
jgi:UTP:GlnB (protein PII) uridylyltransferase